MNTIPEEIRDKIATKAEQYRYATDHVKMCRLTGEYSYSLRQEEMEGIKKHNKEIQDGASLRASEIQFLHKEIERLKGLIEKAYKGAYVLAYNDGSSDKRAMLQSWQQFKTTHNI